VYVTGYDYIRASYTDYCTIKYNDAGTQQWIAHYNGPSNYFDYGSHVTLDTRGNVYVTGRSNESGKYEDYATVKYDSSGSQVWVARYNGPGNDYDKPEGIFVDASSNVYVTGYSDGGASGYDYATVKYGSDGSELWAERYNGPENDDDRAYDIVVDSVGNVVVTGRSPGPGTSYDCTTIKYNSSGTLQWAERYNDPSNRSDQAAALAIDASDNIYMTGGSVNSITMWDFITVKYQNSGTMMWNKRFDGPTCPENGVDEAADITVDVSGNVYVTGRSTAGEYADDFVTVKYDPSGVELWVARYSGPTDDDESRAITVDDAGNVYVTGKSGGSSCNYATVKYNSSGKELWASSYSGASFYRDIATAIAVDTTGNVYVTGESFDSTTDYDYATVKYDPGGHELWAVRYNNKSDDKDRAVAIAVDAAGNVYVTGKSNFTFAIDLDYLTIKYDTDGNLEWLASYNLYGRTGYCYS